jgi:uncharacterized protein (TIGR00369 family)
MTARVATPTRPAIPATRKAAAARAANTAAKNAKVAKAATTTRAAKGATGEKTPRVRRPVRTSKASAAGGAKFRKTAVAGEPKVKDMDRWLGDGGMPVIDAIGASFDDYGTEGDDHVGWATALWEPTPLACNPHGIVQGGVHSVVLDAAMNFAANTGLSGRDRTRATLEMKTELMRPAAVGERLTVRGAVVRMARLVAYAEARVEDAEGRLVSRATGTFLIQREG